MPAPRNHDVTPPMNQAYRPTGRQDERFAAAARGCGLVAHRAELLNLRRHGHLRFASRLRSVDLQIVPPGGPSVTGSVETENHGVGGSVPSLATRDRHVAR